MVHENAECCGKGERCEECYVYYMEQIHPDSCNAICCFTSLGAEDSCEECEDFALIGGIKKEGID